MGDSSPARWVLGRAASHRPSRERCILPLPREKYRRCDVCSARVGEGKRYHAVLMMNTHPLGGLTGSRCNRVYPVTLSTPQSYAILFIQSRAGNPSLLVRARRGSSGVSTPQRPTVELGRGGVQYPLQQSDALQRRRVMRHASQKWSTSTDQSVQAGEVPWTRALSPHDEETVDGMEGRADGENGTGNTREDGSPRGSRGSRQAVSERSHASSPSRTRGRHCLEKQAARQPGHAHT